MANFESGILITQADLLEGDLTPLPPSTRHDVLVAIPERLLSGSRGGTRQRPNIYFALRVWNSYNKSSEVTPLVWDNSNGCPDDTLLFLGGIPVPSQTSATTTSSGLKKDDSASPETPGRTSPKTTPAARTTSTLAPPQTLRTNVALQLGVTALATSCVLALLGTIGFIVIQRLQNRPALMRREVESMSAAGSSS